MVLKQNFQAHLIGGGYTEPKAEAKLIWLHTYSGFQIDLQVFSAIKWQYYLFQPQDAKIITEPFLNRKMCHIFSFPYTLPKNK